VVRQARVDREEITRLVNELPKAERDRLPEVVSSARRLYETIVAIANALLLVEREVGTTSAEAIDKEIAVLESQANPLDTAASESRVRRLAILKRSRRGVAEAQRKRGEYAAKLDECAIALKNMKLDVLRLKAGTESWQRVTSVAEQAMQLARDVDSAVYVGDEMARIGRPAARG
jgi:serine/threonine-protein kinase